MNKINVKITREEDQHLTGVSFESKKINLDGGLWLDKHRMID